MNTLVQSWLSRQCSILRGARRGVVLSSTPGDGACLPIACWPEDQAATPNLLTAAQAALTTGQSVLHSNKTETSGNNETLDVITCPLQSKQGVIGTVAIEVSSRPETEQHAIMQFLSWGTSWLETLIEQKARMSPEPLAAMMDILALSVEHQHLQTAVSAIVTKQGKCPTGDSAGDAHNNTITENLKLKDDLHHAIERDELELHYQPRIDLGTGRIMGMEALIRWHHPEIGMVLPWEIIPLAEESGLIRPIGNWVLKTACRQAGRWSAAGFKDIGVAVNLSAAQFRERNLLGQIYNILRETGTDPCLLELEITESTIMDDIDMAASTMRAMHRSGIRISIDDFGTGYSSLNHLKRFPIDMVKIDRSFVRNISTDPDDASIVGAIITMAHNMGMNVIAEGVETVVQLNHLKNLGCNEVQGFLFSPPVPSDEAEALLESNRNGDTLNDAAIRAVS